MNVLKNNGYEDRIKLFTVTVRDNPRAQTAQKLSQEFISEDFEAFAFESVKSAYMKAVCENSPIVICGSLYLYKDVYESEIRGLSFGIDN